MSKLFPAELNKFIPVEMKKSLFLSLFVIVIFTLPAVIPLTKPGLPSTHDGVTHVVRFTKFHQALTDGQIPPRWAGGIVYNLGSPVLMFNAPLSYLLAEIPFVLGFNLVNSIKIIFALSLAISSIVMYFFLRKIFGELPGILGGIVYLYAPYRFLDVYVRGAYPESVAFIFPPLLLLSGYKLSQRFRRKYFFIGITSLVLLILTHNVIALLFSGVFLIFILALSFINRNLQSLIPPILLIFFAYAISAFYWIPAFFEKGYTNLDKLNESGSYLTNFVTLDKIIYSRWAWGSLGSESPMSVQLGITQILVTLLALSIIALVFLAKKQILSFTSHLLKKSLIIRDINLIQLVLPIIFFVLLLISIFLMTRASLFFWENISLLSFFLYPWRFLNLAVFCTAFLSAFVLFYFKNNKGLFILLLVLAIYANRNHLNLVGSYIGEDNTYKSSLDTTDIWGEFQSSSINLEKIGQCKMEICNFQKVVLPTDFSINMESSNYLELEYRSSKSISGVINIQAFPGWRAYLDNKALSNTSINSLGSYDVVLPKGEHKLMFKFENTPIRDISLYISLLALITLIAYNFFINGKNTKMAKK